jgi:hypothetical protein
MLKLVNWSFHYEHPNVFIDVLVTNESMQLHGCIYLN